MTIWGTQMPDCYEGNPDPDLAAWRNAGGSTVMLKATEGSFHVDSKHKQRADEAHSLGLTVVHYCFTRPDMGLGPAAEMSLLWDTAREAWQPDDILCLDTERGMPPGKGTDQHWIKAGWEMLWRLAHQVQTLYGSTSWLEEQFTTAWVASVRRHQAQYGPKPDKVPWGVGWWAWQHTDGVQGPAPHSVPGFARCDVSQLSARAAMILWSRCVRRGVHKS